MVVAGLPISYTGSAGLVLRQPRSNSTAASAEDDDGFAFDIGIDREHAGDLLEPRARLLHARIGLDHRLRPEHLNDRLKLLSRHVRCLPAEGDRLDGSV